MSNDKNPSDDKTASHADQPADPTDVRLVKEAAKQFEKDASVAQLPEISGYDILREIHHGGQAIVYQAIQLSTKRKVAVKVLLEGKYASQAARRRFEREIELVAQLKHPNIISIFHSGRTDEGFDYCVMDYVRGLRLNRHIRENELTLEEILALFASVCDAVQYAHHKGVIHRDLKPSNILVESDGTPKVLDFGLAKQLTDPVQAVVSVTGQVVGTLPYMSPEQAKGNPDLIDTRTDVYALGVILYELLTGHYPYPVVGDMAEVLRHIAQTPPSPPSRTWKSDSGVTQRSSRRVRVGECPIDNEVQFIAMRALSKERERRYQTAGDLGRDLRHYIAGEPLEARRDSSWYVLRKNLGRHSRAIAVALTLILVGLASVALVQTYRRSQEQARIDVEQRAQALIQEGVKLGLYQRWGEAKEKFEQALVVQPGIWNAYGNLSRLCMNQYRTLPLRSNDQSLLLRAVDYAEEASNANPHKPGPHNNRAIPLMLLGRLDEAESACEDSLNANPAFFNASSTLARVLTMQGDFDSALAAASKAIEIAKEHDMATESWTADSWQTLGALQFHTGEGNAKASFAAAIKCSKLNSSTYVQHARLLLAERNSTLALEEAIAAEKTSDRKDGRIKRIIALAYLMSNIDQLAIDYSESAIKHGDIEFPNHCIAAIAKSRLGDADGAQLALQAAEGTWPDELSAERPLVNVERDILWIDTYKEMNDLRQQAREAVVGG